MNSITELIIVDDSPAIIKAIENMVINYTNYKIVLKAHNGHEAAIKLQTTKYSNCIAIVDINMPVMDGVCFTQFMANRYKDIKVIGISMYSHVEAFSAILEAGAKGFVNKSNLNILQEAIDKVKQGETFIDPAVKADWEKYLEQNKALISKTNEYNLPNQLIEHLQLLPADITNAQKALLTSQSVHTINQHQKDIKKITGYSSKPSQLIFAIRERIVKTFKAN
ncbi:MAG: response regulator transcription factor [Bacteroidota bacterium]